LNVTIGSRSPKRPTYPVVFSLIIFLQAVLPVSAPVGKTLSASENEAASNFKLRCSSCHGVNGNGDTSLGRTLKAADLRSAEVQKQSDEQLTQIIADGRKNMPSFGNSLTQDQIRALVAYIRKLAGKVQK
jgi:mono/diheme cytochrome c family protein